MCGRCTKKTTNGKSSNKNKPRRTNRINEVSNLRQSGRVEHSYFTDVPSL